MKNLSGLNFAKHQTDTFHRVFGHPMADTPTLPDNTTVQNRVNYIAEELVEALGAMANSSNELTLMVDSLSDAIFDAEVKQKKEGFIISNEDKLVALADAFTDINYFNQGNFTIIGVEPQPLFNIVQEANMAKLGADGKPIIRESDGKIMKPKGWAENHAPEPKLAAEIKRQMEANK